jgi:predicted ATP-dependent endonuclease of OLD family
MRLSSLYIGNFRKLKGCRIDIDEKETILVGANNSGKTTAMNALVWFCKPGRPFKTKDFTLTNWDGINQIGQEWIEAANPMNVDLSITRWGDFLPFLDVWIRLENDNPDENVNLVSSLFNTLEDNPQQVGVRIRFEPDDTEELYRDFIAAYRNSQNIQEGRENRVEIYPKNLLDFLEHEDSKNLNKYFKLKYYKLNEGRLTDGAPQACPDRDLGTDVLRGIIKIDTISAEREFADPQLGSNFGLNTLSGQLQEFYRNHISPTNNLTADDVDLLKAIEDANAAFNENLKRGFHEAIDELADLNYPGYLNPNIEIQSKLKPEEGIRHESAVRFKINPREQDEAHALHVDESYNGLGYRNLISMYFRLIQFRKNWLKLNKRREDDIEDLSIEPIHLVCIEEPEAHLHAQAQKVFVKRAYGTLTKDVEDNPSRRTQMIISTHSNHVVLGVDFDHVRYFRRYHNNMLGIPVSDVVNMSTAFGNNDETKRFVTRYIKLTHCDMFFADGIIMVEGAAERILMPIFLNQSELRSKYVSVIEISGAHAHRFKPLIEKLEISTLVITDLDASGKKPQRGKEQKTTNSTLRNWMPQKENVDELIDLPDGDKINGHVRIAYQTPIKVKYKGKRRVEIIPYTFEDALAFANMDAFIEENGVKGNGLTKKIRKAFEEDTAGKCHEKMISAMYNDNGKKAELATDILMWDNAETNLNTPVYIEEGLNWLNDQLRDTPDA